MIRKIIRIIIALLGMSLGLLLYVNSEPILFEYFNIKGKGLVFTSLVCVLFVCFFGIIFFILAPYCISKGEKLANSIQKDLSKMPLSDMLVSLAGLMIGIFIAYLLSGIVKTIPIAGYPLTMVLYIFFGYLGVNISRLRKDELIKILTIKKSSFSKEKSLIAKNHLPAKILDTSVIIDGRIAEIIQSGFLEGVIIVPEFVLKELQHIADSSDDIKRVRGRRGLDILNAMQSDENVNIEISDADFPDVPEVDIKLLKLAQKLNATVITNDFNLNKVAQFQKVRVLNINQLANAVKTQYLPGEKIALTVIKEGKESSQGIGYLDDGTMIVVEDGKKLIGKDIQAVVTSVLQTAAGRMIFARVQN